MNTQPSENLTRLRPLHKWHEQHVKHGGSVFPTYASLKWFVRQRRDDLLASGVLIPGKGGRPNLVTPLFGDAVYKILFKGVKPE